MEERRRISTEGGGGDDGQTDGQSEGQGPKQSARERESPAPFEMRINPNGSKAFYDPPSFPLFSLIFSIWWPLPSEQGKLTMKHSDRRSPSRKKQKTKKNCAKTQGHERLEAHEQCGEETHLV